MESSKQTSKKVPSENLIARPKRSTAASFDDEEAELLAMQERFLRSGEKPSTKVVRVPKKETQKPPEPKQEEPPPVERDVVTLSDTEPVLLEIKERDAQSFVPQFPKFRTTPFPEILSREFFAKKPKQPQAASKEESTKPTVAVDSSKTINVENINQELNALTNGLYNKLFIDSKNQDAPLAEWRFDFQGNVVKKEEEVDTKEGLHHHGEEQQAAGYALHEIFHLIRSSFPSQRSINLNLITHIIRKAKNREYATFDDKVNVIREIVMRTELPLLLRMSIDDQHNTPLLAGVEALHSLIVTPQEERWFDAIELHYRGFEGLSLQPKEPQEYLEGGEEEENVSDSEELRRDMIYGYIVTGLLDRLRYILSSAKITAAVPVAFDILIRCCRHSNYACKQLTSDPSFIDLLRKEFFDNRSRNKGEYPYGYPFPRAIKLLRVMSQSGVQRYQDLYNCGIITALKNVMKMKTEVDSNVYRDMVLEAIKVWRVSVCYGFSLDSEIFQFLELTASELESDNNMKSLEILSAVFNLVEQFAHSANRQKTAITSMLHFAEFSVTLFSKVNGMWKPSEGDSLKSCLLNTIATVLHLWSTLFELKEKFTDLSAECKQNIVTAFSSFSASNVLSWMMDKCNMTPTVIESFDLNNLPYLSLTHSQTEQLITRRHVQNSALACVRLLCSLQSIGMIQSADYTAAINSLHSVLIRLTESYSYVASEVPDYNRYDSRLGNYIVYHLLKLFTEIMPSREKKSVQQYLDIALRLVYRYGSGDEYYLNNTISTFIFSSSVTSQLVSSSSISTAFGEEQYNLMRTFYLRYISGSPSQSNKDVQLVLEPPTAVNRKTLLIDESDTLPFSRDWIFLPIPLLLKASNTADRASDEMSLALVTSTLTFILMLEHTANKYISEIPVEIKLYHLMKVFMINSTLFTDAQIEQLLSQLLSLYAASTTLNFDQVIGKNFFSFFKEFVTQFVANSFGSKIWAQFLLLFFRRDIDSKYRKIILSELHDVLHFLNVEPLESPSTIVRHLSPAESDADVLKLYEEALVNGTLNKSRSSYLHWIAVHHLSAFVFAEGTSQWLQSMCLHNILSNAPKEVSLDVLNYRYTEGQFPPKEPLQYNYYLQDSNRSKIVSQLVKEDNTLETFLLESQQQPQLKE